MVLRGVTVIKSLAWIGWVEPGGKESREEAVAAEGWARASVQGVYWSVWFAHDRYPTCINLNKKPNQLTGSFNHRNEQNFQMPPRVGCIPSDQFGPCQET